jgi:hypothetical protein
MPDTYAVKLGCTNCGQVGVTTHQIPFGQPVANYVAANPCQNCGVNALGRVGEPGAVAPRMRRVSLSPEPDHTHEH